VEVTPVISTGRQVIESYGASGFRVSGASHHGAILVFPDATVAWAGVSGPGELTAACLAAVIERGGIDILLVGCGRRAAPLLPALRARLREAGIVVDVMDTGAACRTYNVLLAEDRRVAAALLPMG
jgi:uncharacterized protein